MLGFVSNWFRSSSAAKLAASAPAAINSTYKCSFAFTTNNGNYTYKVDLDYNICNQVKTFLLNNNTCGAVLYDHPVWDGKIFASTCSSHEGDEIFFRAVHGTMEVITDALRCFINTLGKMCIDERNSDFSKIGVPTFSALGGVAFLLVTGFILYNKREAVQALPGRLGTWAKNCWHKCWGAPAPTVPTPVASINTIPTGVAIVVNSSTPLLSPAANGSVSDSAGSALAVDIKADAKDKAGDKKDEEPVSTGEDEPEVGPAEDITLGNPCVLGTSAPSPRYF